jgi:hypothetical protein
MLSPRRGKGAKDRTFLLPQSPGVASGTCPVWILPGCSSPILRANLPPGRGDGICIKGVNDPHCLTSI